MGQYEIVKKAGYFEKGVEVVGNRYYQFYIKDYGNNDYRIDIDKVDEKLPTIYIKRDWRGGTGNKYGIKSVTIQSVAWGEMDIEDTERFIEYYKVALGTVKEIKKFLNL